MRIVQTALLYLLVGLVIIDGVDERSCRTHLSVQAYVAFALVWPAVPWIVVWAGEVTSEGFDWRKRCE